MTAAGHQILNSLRQTIEVEASGLAELKAALGDDTIAVVQHLAKLEGRVICAGVGKSGHVARKIAATLASTGTPAMFVHPSEASHGDLGMITPKDAVLALSKSGETKELGDLIAYCRRFSVPLFGMTTNAESALGRNSTNVLLVPNAKEACGETRAPTTSTTLMMALGDALAVALIELRGFTAEDFKRYHPGGALGAALTQAEDIMHTGEAIPTVAPTSQMSVVVDEMTQKGFGCVGVIDGDQLIGIITDGDLRRNLTADLPTKTASDIMTRGPKTVEAGTLAADIMRELTGGQRKLTQVFVVDDEHRPIGFIHMHDLLRIGVS